MTFRDRGAAEPIATVALDSSADQLPPELVALCHTYGEMTVCFFALGPRAFKDAFGSDGISLDRPSIDRAANPLLRHFTLEARRGGAPAFWAVAHVHGGQMSVEASYDDPPPAWLSERCPWDTDDDARWLAHVWSRDKRPRGELPEWLKAKFEAMGAWDREKDQLAVDKRGNPLHGEKLFGPRKELG